MRGDINSGEIDLYDTNFKTVFETVLDYLDQTFAEKRKYFKRMYVSIAGFVANKTMTKGGEPNAFAEMLDAFFGVLSQKGKYMVACLSGSSKCANLQTRLRIMGEAFITTTSEAMAKTGLSQNENEPKRRSKENEIEKPSAS